MNLAERVASIMNESFQFTMEENIILSLSLVMMASAVITFIFLTCFQKATYGRYGDQGYFQNLAIPAKVAWIVQEAPSLILPALALSEFGDRVTLPRFIAFAMFIGHYWQRTLIYPVLIVGGKRTPPHLVLLGFIFCLWNGFIQGFYHVKYAKFEPSHAWDLWSQIGIGTFLLGMFINIHSDSILRNLRKPGDQAYYIPHGGMFEYVSGANFLGEILEWLGYAIYCRTFPAIAFAMFTMANIGPRAMHHHQYYLDKFDDYPADRRALIPFVL